MNQTTKTTLTQFLSSLLATGLLLAILELFRRRNIRELAATFEEVEAPDMRSIINTALSDAIGASILSNREAWADVAMGLQASPRCVWCGKELPEEDGHNDVERQSWRWISGPKEPFTFFCDRVHMELYLMTGKPGGTETE